MQWVIQHFVNRSVPPGRVRPNLGRLVVQVHGVRVAPMVLDLPV
jgi:hypothetical protein